MVFGILFCFLPLIVFFLIFTFAYKLNVFYQLIAILIGLLSVIPISLIQYFVPDINDFANNYPIFYSLLKSLILYAVIEEVIKMLFLFFLPISEGKLSRNNKIELTDSGTKAFALKRFILFGFIMGLSVGCFESGVYFFEHMQKAKNAGSQLLYIPIFIRMFSAVIIHFSCTGLCALFMFGLKNKITKISLMLSAILIHGIFDFFAGFQNSFKYFAFAVVLFSIIECRLKYKNLQENIDKTIDKD